MLGEDITYIQRRCYSSNQLAESNVKAVYKSQKRRDLLAMNVRDPSFLHYYRNLAFLRKFRAVRRSAPPWSIHRDLINSGRNAAHRVGSTDRCAPNAQNPCASAEVVRLPGWRVRSRAHARARWTCQSNSLYSPILGVGSSLREIGSVPRLLAEPLAIDIEYVNRNGE